MLPTIIELIEIQTNKTTYVNLGQTIGTIDVELPLDATDVGDIRFQINMDDAQQLIVERVGGTEDLILDKKKITAENPRMTAYDGSRLIVGTVQYRLRKRIEDTRSDWHIAFNTVTGPIRAHNEDTIAIFHQPPAYFLAVADGVGGQSAGEYISAIASQQLLRSFMEIVDKPEYFISTLSQRIKTINDQVWSFGVQLSKKYGGDQHPGTTITAMAIFNRQLYILHIGDSRLYRFRDGKLQQLTSDHVAIIENKNPQTQTTRKNIRLTRAIGRTAHVKIDTFLDVAELADIYLLCSDGLTDFVSDEEITAALDQYNFFDVPQHLTNLAESREARDNITVLIAQATINSKIQQTPMDCVIFADTPTIDLPLEFADIDMNRRVRRRSNLLLFLFLVLFLLIVIVVGILTLSNRSIAQDALNRELNESVERIPTS